jgi:hypothetical protein
LKGLVIDDEQAIFSGKWSKGSGLKGFVGTHYRYSRSGQARYPFTIPESGPWDVRVNWLPHENRSSRTRVLLELSGKVVAEQRVNQRQAALLKNGFHSLGRHTLTAGQKGAVILLTEGADGNVHADTVQLLRVK